MAISSTRANRLAHRLLANCESSVIDSLNILAAMYPELPEVDWERIRKKTLELLRNHETQAGPEPMRMIEWFGQDRENDE